MPSKLSSYTKKRNLKKSGEPSVCARSYRGAKNKKSERGHEPKAKIPKTKSKKLIYVIQKHDASHLHHDLRLEMNRTLKSWAVPKEPPTKKGIKRLAIQVEDHPLSYARFQGEIKSGYGKGTVEIWDEGTYELLEKDPKKIEIKIHGKKLKGNYVLIKTNYGNKPEKSWLFMKV